MRILTVRQPWAWALIHGGKDVENRVRNIAGDYRGPVAIHAGLEDEPLAWVDWRIASVSDRYTGRLRNEAASEARGAIIGVVNLWAVHQDRDSGNCCPHRPSGGPGGSPWAERDVWHLCLSDPRPLAEPIPYKGALGLRTLPDDVADAIRGQL